MNKYAVLSIFSLFHCLDACNMCSMRLPYAWASNQPHPSTQCTPYNTVLLEFFPIHSPKWCVFYFVMFDLWMCNHVFRLQNIRNKLKTRNNMELCGIMLCAHRTQNNFNMMKLYHFNTDVIHCQNVLSPSTNIFFLVAFILLLLVSLFIFLFYTPILPSEIQQNYYCGIFLLLFILYINKPSTYSTCTQMSTAENKSVSRQAIHTLTVDWRYLVV